MGPNCEASNQIQGIEENLEEDLVCFQNPGGLHRGSVCASYSVAPGSIEFRLYQDFSALMRFVLHCLVRGQ